MGSAQVLGWERETVLLETRQEHPISCPDCGTINRPGALYCLVCGARLAPLDQIAAGLIGERDRVRRAYLEKAALCPPPQPGDRAPNWQAFGLSDVGRTRANNEDSVLVSPLPGGGWLLIVADGMGGAEAGEVASATTALLLRDLVERQVASDPAPMLDHRPALAQAVEAINTALYRQARATPAMHGMGSTVTAALVQGTCVELAHVGDSRAYRLTGEHQLQRLTLDHSIVEHMVRLGQLTPAEAQRHPLRNQLYRAVGTEGTIEVDTYVYALAPHDRLLLCSDGLTLHCDEAEIAAILSQGRSPEAVADALVRRALDYGADDNVTVAVLLAV